MKKLVIICSIISLFVLFVTLYILFIREPSVKENESQTTSDGDFEFNGNILKATLKPGWEMYESFRYIPVSYTYEPQTLINQFSLFKNGRLKFTLTPESRSGLNTCSTLYTFNDTSNKYIENIQKNYTSNSPTSYIPLKIENIADGYSSLMLLNQEVRRINNSVFIDRSNDNTFDADCGDLSKNSIYLFGIRNVVLDYFSTSVSNIFYINLYDDLSSIDGEELDNILNSIKPIDIELHDKEECKHYSGNLEQLTGIKTNSSSKNFLVIDNYLKGFCNFSYNNINLYLVNSKGFKSSLELLEKMRFNTITSDEYVSENKIEFNNGELPIYLMRLPTGRAYFQQVIGAYIDGDKGYYFTIDIDLTAEVTPEGETESILRFTNENNPSSNLEFISKIIEADFPINIFQEYPGNYYKDSRVELIKNFTNYNYPKSI